jgi:1,4-dihydroxy-2-naphthoate octaprenyltransferase
MTTTSQWIEGARPRTLPAAISPVLVGTGAAAALDDVRPVRALLALLVALALQVGVNYANDYRDRSGWSVRGWPRPPG